MIIAYKHSSTDREPSLELLYWRSISDFGLAVRFILNNAFNRMVCGSENCYLISNGQTDLQGKLIV